VSQRTFSIRSFSAAIAVTITALLGRSSVADGPCLSVDLNGDGVINGADLALLLGAWNSAGSPFDLDGNGTIDGADLAMLLGAWSGAGSNSCIAVTTISPASGPPGSDFKLTGNFPDSSLKNYSIMGDAPWGSQPMKPVTSGGVTSLTGRAGPSWTAGFIPLMVSLGQGSDAPVTRTIAGANLAGTLSWKSTSIGVTSKVSFNIEPPSEPPHVMWATIKNGALELVVDAPGSESSRLRVWVRAVHEGTGLASTFLAIESRISCLSLQRDQDMLALATTLGASIEAVFAAHQPQPIAVQTTVGPGPGGAAILRLAPVGAAVTDGYLVVEFIDSSEVDCACDGDGDGVSDCVDNCPTVVNPDQADGNGNGIGDACEGPGLCDPETCWYDFDGDGVVTGIDIGHLFQYLLIPCSGTAICCADLNGDGVVDRAEAMAYASTYFGAVCP